MGWPAGNAHRQQVKNETSSLLQEGLIAWQRLLGPRQITDAYLLALAVSHGGRFVTFDRRINVDLVPGAAAANLCILLDADSGPWLEDDRPIAGYTNEFISDNTKKASTHGDQVPT